MARDVDREQRRETEVVKAREIREQDHKKAIFGLSGWYLVNMVLVKAAGLWLLPIYTALLTPAEYGVLRTLMAFAMAFPMLISLALEAAYTRYYFQECEKEDGLRRLVSTYFWFILAWGIIVVIGGNVACEYFLRPRLAIAFWPYIPLAMAIPLLQKLVLMGSLHYTQRLKAKEVSLIDSLTFFVGTATTLYLLVAMHYGILSMLIGGFCAAAVALAIYLTILVKEGLLAFEFDFALLRQGLRFSLPFVPTLACGWIANLSDRLVIMFYGTTTSVGIYSVGYDLARTMALVKSSVLRIFDPLLWSTIVTDVDRAKKRIERFLPFYFWILFGAAATLSLFSREIIVILTKKTFHAAWHVIPIVAFAHLVAALYAPFSSILAYRDKAWLIALGSFVQAFANLALNIIFVPIFGAMAAAWTTLGSFSVLTLWTWYYSRKYVKIEIKWSFIGTTIFVGAASLALYLLAAPFIGEALWQTLLLKTFVLVFACLLSYLLPVYDKRDDEIYPLSAERTSEPKS